MLIACVIIFLLLIFPIFINIKIKYLSQKKRLYFIFKLYNAIKLLKGYVHLVYDGFAIHLSKYNAIIFPYKNLLKMRNKIKPLKDYHIINLNIKLDVGKSDSLISPLLFVFLYNYIANYIKSAVYNNKPYVQFNRQTNVHEGENIFNLEIKGVVALNLLMILISLIKIFTEKIIYAIKNRKQQNQ